MYEGMGARETTSLRERRKEELGFSPKPKQIERSRYQANDPNFSFSSALPFSRIPSGPSSTWTLPSQPTLSCSVPSETWTRTSTDQLVSRTPSHLTARYWD